MSLGTLLNLSDSRVWRWNVQIASGSSRSRVVWYDMTLALTLPRCLTSTGFPSGPACCVTAGIAPTSPGCLLKSPVSSPPFRESRRDATCAAAMAHSSPVKSLRMGINGLMALAFQRNTSESIRPTLATLTGLPSVVRTANSAMATCVLRSPNRNSTRCPRWSSAWRNMPAQSTLWDRHVSGTCAKSMIAPFRSVASSMSRYGASISIVRSTICMHCSSVRRPL